MNKNTKRKRNAALDAFHRKYKSLSDEILARSVGHRDRLDKKPKVAASAAAITTSVGRNRA